MDVMNAVIGPQFKLLIVVITAFDVFVQHLFHSKSRIFGIQQINQFSRI
jgi:hypothetical protein